MANAPTQILSFDCLIYSRYDEEILTFRLYYIRLITFALLPLIIEMFCWLFWAVYGRCKKMKKKDRWDRSNATSIIILFLFYSTIVSELAKSLSCKEIEGVKRLYEDLE